MLGQKRSRGPSHISMRGVKQSHPQSPSSKASLWVATFWDLAFETEDAYRTASDHTVGPNQPERRQSPIGMVPVT